MSEFGKRLQSMEETEIRVSLQKKLAIPLRIDGSRWHMQGGGSDGRYAYYAINSGGDSRHSITRIHKIDLATWQIVGISGDLRISHANDIAYDPKHHRLIVSWCDVEPEKVGIVDPDTLELLETKTIPQRHFSLAYHVGKSCYVAGKSKTYDLVLLNDAFEPVRTLPGVEGYVKQGLECDEVYIYFFQTGKEANWIFVFDWNGELKHRVEVPMVGESENLFVCGEKLICAFNDTEREEGSIYELSLMQG